VRVEQNSFHPSLFDVPSIAVRDEVTGIDTGGAFVTSLWASAAAG